MQVLHEPVVSLEGVKIDRLTVSSIELDVAIRVQNKNPIGVTVKELPFRVLCEDCETTRLVATGNTGQITIPPNDSILLHVPVKSDNAILLSALAALAAQGSVKVTIKGAAVIDCILFHWSVPFSKDLPVTMDQIVKAAGAGKK